MQFLSSCDVADLVDADNILGDQDVAFMDQEERYDFVLKKEMLIGRRIAELNFNEDDANLYETYVLSVFIFFEFKISVFVLINSKIMIMHYSSSEFVVCIDLYCFFLYYC